MVPWLLLTYRLPPERSSARVTVWREVRRAGALQLQQSIIAFPDTEEFRRAVERIRAVVSKMGGSAIAIEAQPRAPEDEERLVSSWNEARAAEYDELAAECEKLVVEIDKEFAKQKFTLAELDEEEAELEKLKAWHGRIATRDVHDCDRAADAAAALERAAEALSRYTEAVFERTQS
jgi:vacuolar-type H+-ATPase subunit I/STV1